MSNPYADGFDEGYKAGLKASSAVADAIINEQRKRIAELETLKSELLSIQKEWSAYTWQLKQRIAELEDQVAGLQAAADSLQSDVYSLLQATGWNEER